MAKFLKAFATWKLERGTTVGLMQHLLGSRSLVSSIMTPIKLRMATYLVPLLVLMWILNPIGGQTSLRVVSKQSNITDLSTPFHYLDVLRSDHSGNAADIDVINVNFNTALSSPVSAKNGSQVCATVLAHSKRTINPKPKLPLSVATAREHADMSHRTSTLIFRSP